MGPSRRLCLVLMLAVLAAACNGQATAPITFDRLQNLPYKGSDTLDIYVPAGAGPFPVMIILHGASGNRVGYAPLGEALATEGMVVLNVTWLSDRVSRNGVEGVACAVWFARAVATDHGATLTTSLCSVTPQELR